MVRRAQSDRKKALEDAFPEQQQVQQATKEVKKELESIEKAFLDGLITEDNKAHWNEKMAEVRYELARLQTREKELSQLIAAYKYDLNFDDAIKELRTSADALNAAGNDAELKRAFITSRVWRVKMTDLVNFRIQLNGGNSRRKAEMWIEGSLG